MACLRAHLATAVHPGYKKTDFRMGRDSRLVRTHCRCFDIPTGAARLAAQDHQQIKRPTVRRTTFYSLGEWTVVDSPDRKAGLSSPKTYEHRFGSITRAYELIGCLNPRVSAMLAMRSHSQNLREEMIGKLRSLFPGDLTVIQRSGRWRTRLRLKEQDAVFPFLLQRRFDPGRLRFVGKLIRFQRNVVLSRCWWV